MHRTIFERRRIARTVLPELPSLSGPAIVVGSAPNSSPPVELLRRATTICVNASQHKLDASGIAAPAFAVMRSSMKKDPARIENIETRAVLAGRSTGCLIVVGPSPESRAGQLETLEEIGYRHDRLIEVSKRQVNKIIDDLVGPSWLPGIYAPSTGIAAVILALHIGANPVVMSGFSFSGGHSYGHGGLPRKHVDEDSSVLRAVARAGRAVFTSDPDFALDAHMELWRP